MSTTSTTVGIRLQLEGAGSVERGLAGVQARVGDAAKALGALAAGTLSAAAFTSWIKGAIDAADQTSKLAQSTGLLTEEVAGLKLAFEQSGVGDKFAEVMAKLSSEAAKGNKAFSAMGVSVTDASGKLKGTRDLLADVADKFAGYADGSAKTALAVALLGESGAKAIPLLNGGAAALADFDEKAKALGLTIDTKTAKAAEAFNDQLDLVLKRSQGAGLELANQLLPALVQVTDAMAKGAQSGGSLASVGGAIATVFETVAVVGVNVGYVLTQVGNELGGLAAQAVAVAQLNFEAAGEIGRMMRADAEAARKEVDALSDRILNARRRMAIGVASADDQSSAEARRLGLATLRETAPVIETNTKATVKNTAAKKANADAERDAAKAAAELAKTRERIAALADRETEDTLRRVAGLIEGNEALRDEIAMVGASAERRAELVSIKEREAIAQMELNLVVAQSNGATLETIAIMQQEINLRRQRLALVDQKSAAESAQAMQEETYAALRNIGQRAETEWDRTAAYLGDAIAGGIMAGFESGKGFADGFLSYLANQLKQTFAKELSNSITGAVQSYLTGNNSSFLNSAVGAAYQYYTGASAGASTASLTYANAVGAFGGDSLGALYTANGGWAGVSAGGAGASAGGVGAGSSASSLMGTAGYAALIVAAVVAANNLYNAGYNREALGDGPARDYRFGNYSTFTNDANIGNSAIYNSSFERFKRSTLEFAGLSDKWADIFSGTTRMATLFGRKLSGYGYEAQITGDQVDVSGYAKYKGGLFRSNKTVAVDIDPRDAELLKQQVESVRESSRAMARALGYSTEEIDAYTGSLKVNFKGAKTAEEQSQRLGEAMDELQTSLLKAASGGKFASKEFEQMMEGVRQSIQNAGISTEALADILLQGMTGRLSSADVGAQLSEVIIGGIYNSIASNYAGVIAQAFTSQIITPIFTALAAGVPISQAISKSAIENIVATANQAAQALNEIFNNAEFQAAISGIQTAIGGVSSAVGSVRPPVFRVSAPKPVNTAAADAAREKEQLEREILRLTGDTTELRRRELLEIKPGNRALQERIWALEDEAAALDQVKDLQSAWRDLTDSVDSEIKRLRGLVLGDSVAGLAYVQAQFATTTAQARAMDQEAAARLPELSGQLSELFLEASTSASDYQARINSLAASLEETNRITRSTAGVDADSTQKVKDEELAAQIELLQRSIDVLATRMEENNKAAAATAAALSKASVGGAIRTVAA